MATNKKIKERNTSTLHKYEVTLDCGCCTDILYFKNDESALQAMKNAGLDISAEIIDDAGIKHENIDTFYGIIKLTKKVLRERRMEDK